MKLVLSLLLLGMLPQPRTRAFHLDYVATVNDIPPGAAKVELWMPVPHDDAYQQIRNLKIESANSYTISSAADGNQMLHLQLEHPPSTVTVNMSLDAVREEHIQDRLLGAPPLAKDEDPATLAQYLKPDRLVPIDDQIRKWAHEVVEQAGAKTDLEEARAIYNHVVSTVKYDKTGQGWGRGDIYYACEERRGNCTDFHAIVIGYARALGIPARFAIGLPLPAQHGEGKIAGYHCWAEVYIKHIGWVPIDASEAAKNPARRQYFFGAHDENRLEFSKGRDLILTPKQQGDPLNYFVFPYAEVDGQPFKAVTTEVNFKDVN